MRERPFLKLYYVRIEIVRFDNEFFLSCFPKLILKIPYTLWLGIIAFAAAFVLELDPTIDELSEIKTAI